MKSCSLNYLIINVVHNEVLLCAVKAHDCELNHHEAKKINISDTQPLPWTACETCSPRPLDTVVFRPCASLCGLSVILWSFCFFLLSFCGCFACFCGYFAPLCSHFCCYLSSLFGCYV